MRARVCQPVRRRGWQVRWWLLQAAMVAVRVAVCGGGACELDGGVLVVVRREKANRREGPVLGGLAGRRARRVRPGCWAWPVLA